MSEDRQAKRPDESGLIVQNAMRCGICGAPADRYHWGYQCRANLGHVGDPTLGLFEDLSLPADTAKRRS